MPCPPFSDVRVHHFLPSERHKRDHRHDGIAVWHLWGLVIAVGLQQRKPSGGFIVVIGMALQIDQQPVRRFLRRVPRMARQHMFVFTVAR